MISNLGINASRARSGGAISHLVGIMNELGSCREHFKLIHIWSYKELLDALPNQLWLIKHEVEELNLSLIKQLWWEKFKLPKALHHMNCEILLNIDAGSICRFRPAVTMSRDMLSYEPIEMKRYGFSRGRLRLIILKFIQNLSFKSSDGVIFLTKYAAEIIQETCGQLNNISIIPHGVDLQFKNLKKSKNNNVIDKICCLYISNALPYKHQWHVIDALILLRKKGYPIELNLVGGGEGASQKRLNASLSKLSKDQDFVMQHKYVPKSELVDFLNEADLFIFASSCENMPNTLLEAMASGLPIACSDRGPMPEILGKAGLYFDPEVPESIAECVSRIIDNPESSLKLAFEAKQLSKQYSWKRCAMETVSFLDEVANLNTNLTKK